MKFGFIGAGKVGCSLGHYFSSKHSLIGYASKTLASAKEAASATSSQAYASYAELLKECDILFFTTPDSCIDKAWHTLLVELSGTTSAYKNNACSSALGGKIICHCSGATPSTVFDKAEEFGASVYSVHPLFAIASKNVPTNELARAYFTIEGTPDKIDQVKAFIEVLGNKVTEISTVEKTRYHAAAALASNHAVALYQLACDELVKCGFTTKSAAEALAPLYLGNAQHIAEVGPVAALTGPAERGDTATIDAHLNVLEGNTKEVYTLLNTVLLKIADEKHGSR